LKRLLLVGGGHAHLAVLADLARAPLPGWEVTLVSPYRRQIYSGMLPGWVAGHYAIEQCAIPLDRLAVRAGVAFVQEAATALDLTGRTVACSGGASHGFDALSIDIGPAPALDGLPGAAVHAQPLRPIEGFVAAWPAIADGARTGEPFHLVVLGAGAGGVELAFAARQRALDAGGAGLRVTLVGADASPMQGASAGAQARVLEALGARGIAWMGVRRAQGFHPGRVDFADAPPLAFDACLVATGAAAHPWAAASGLAADADGFIRVSHSLQSSSHPFVFAAGDIAALSPAVPRSGVYAVRAGVALARNLRAHCTGQALEAWRPQPRALYLVSTGDRHAIAMYGGVSWEGRWVWRLKDWIDRRFVRNNAGAA
jgi:selenide,water dikinase